MRVAPDPASNQPMPMLNRLVLLLSLTFAAAGVTHAADGGHDHPGGSHEDSKATPADQADWLAAAKAAYPLETCVVSGDKLEGGDMGHPIDYVHKVDGMPDRLVRFCCRDCVRDFKTDPAKYLAMIDTAAADKQRGSDGGHEGHSGHKH